MTSRSDGGDSASRTPSSPPRKRSRPNGPSSVSSCETCLALLSREGVIRANSSDGFRHLSRREAEVTTRRGCPMCRFLCDNANKVWGAEDRLFLHSEPGAGGWEENVAPGDLKRLDVVTGSVRRAGEPAHSVIVFTAHASPDDPASQLVRRRPVIRDVNRPNVWAAACRALAECQTHEKCPPQKLVALPTRLIDVGSLQFPQAKLHICMPEQHGQYLALSYCWGGDQQLKAEKRTIESLTENIDTTRLPQTIQDAILCTRELDFRYLWVDALCILQDSNDDKAIEIPRMAQIYQNATLTIAASVARQAHNGFLALYHPYEYQYEVTISIAGLEMGTISLATEYVPDHPLDRRSWALQEFLLSPRMLLFSDYEVLWQCHTEELHGITSDGLEYLQPLEGLPFGIFAKNPDISSSAMGSTEAERLRTWKDIVKQYTLREMTNKDDRPGAIEGVAVALAHLWEDKYRFGLWMRWVLDLLAWFLPEDLVEERQRTRALRAPTWSWMSVDGRIDFEDPFERIDAQLVEGKDLVVLRNMSRALQLRCRIVSKGSVMPVDLLHVHENLDLVSDEAFGEETHYLLLGFRENYGEEAGFGLVIVQIKETESSYRRIGYVEFEEPSLFDGIEARNIILL